MRFTRYNADVERLADGELFAMLGSRADAEQAFKELYRRHSARLRAYCHTILACPEDADDVFQETFVRFFASARQERTMTNVPGFLFRIARNLCLNAKRRAGRDSLDGLEPVATTGHSFENEELLALIRGAVAGLEPHLREAFVLRDYDGMSYEEIGALLGETIPAVKSRVHRARKRVRAILARSIAELR